MSTARLLMGVLLSISLEISMAGWREGGRRSILAFIAELGTSGSVQKIFSPLILSKMYLQQSRNSLLHLAELRSDFLQVQRWIPIF